jgi:hypothetical protein
MSGTSDHTENVIEPKKQAARSLAGRQVFAANPKMTDTKNLEQF